MGQFLCPYVLVTKLEQWKINNYETHAQSRLVYLRCQDSVKFGHKNGVNIWVWILKTFSTAQGVLDSS